MLLAETVLAESLDDLAGHFVDVILIRCFDLKVEVGAVIVADGSIAFYDRLAVLKQMRDIFVVVFLHQVHGSKDVLVIKIGLLVVAS